MEKVSLSANEKVLKILMAFTPHNTGLTTNEISKKLGIHQSTTSRLLHLLQSYDFLMQDSKTKQYRLGSAAAQIGMAITSSLRSGIVSLAEPYILGLRDSVGESVSLNVLLNDTFVKAYAAQSTQRLTITDAIGDRLPAHAAAGAKVILAFSPDEVVKRCLGKELKRFTPSTITDIKIIKKQLDAARRKGVAYDLGEYFQDVFAIAAPVFTYTNQAEAAIVISGPGGRMKPLMKSETVSLLKKTAARISEQLLYRGDCKDTYP